MKFVQRGVWPLLVGMALLGVAGCSSDNQSNISEGTIPPDAPKSSMDAMKSMSNMTPAGAEKSKGGSRQAPPPPPATK